MLSVASVYAKLVCRRRPEGPVELTGDVQAVASTQNKVRGDQRTCVCVCVRVCVYRRRRVLCVLGSCAGVGGCGRTRANCGHVVAAYIASGEINVQSNGASGCCFGFCHVDTIDDGTAWGRSSRPSQQRASRNEQATKCHSSRHEGRTRTQEEKAQPERNASGCFHAHEIHHGSPRLACS